MQTKKGWLRQKFATHMSLCIYKHIHMYVLLYYSDAVPPYTLYIPPSVCHKERLYTVK